MSEEKKLTIFYCILMAILGVLLTLLITLPSDAEIFKDLYPNIPNIHHEMKE